MEIFFGNKGMTTITRCLMVAAAFLTAEALAAPQANRVGAFRPDSTVQPRPETQADKSLDKAGFINLFSLVPAESAGRLGVTAAVGDDPRPELSAYRSSFDRSEVEARPGYFSVPLKDNGVKVDFTAVDKVAAYRFTFPESKAGCHVVLDISQPLDQFKGGEVRLRDSKSVEGFGVYQDQAGEETTLFFSFQFTEAIRRRGVWKNDALENKHFARLDQGAPMGFYVYFWDTHVGETILMKVGVSSTSIDDARANVVQEFPGWDFKQLRRESEQAWTTR